MTNPEVEALYFTGERAVEVRQLAQPEPKAGEALVMAEVSAISTGTEMLIYRNQMPVGMSADSGLSSLPGALAYPLHYGYCMVGKVTGLGDGVAREWLGQRVFAFQPHASGFTAKVDELVPVPGDTPAEDAVFLANMETAVNFILDGRPMLGEKVCVLGQGVVGLLTTALLGIHPLGDLIALDRLESRRRWAIDLGAWEAFDPAAAKEAKARLSSGAYPGADLVFEVSGVPEALNLAIRLTGFNGRVVIGSWYGRKQATLDLGGDFHRQRIQLVGSQVSTVTPELSGRWQKARRFEVAWGMIRRLKPSRLITHRFGLKQARDAYRLLDAGPESALQVVFNYGEKEQ